MTAIAPTSTRVRMVLRFFELLREKDIDTWIDLWDDDARILAPYPPDGFPTTIEGKAAILEAFQGMFANFTAFESEITALYPAEHSDAVCVEYRNRATLSGGTPYTNDNIAVFRFNGRRISDYHDYFDPRRFQTVIDHLGSVRSGREQ